MGIALGLGVVFGVRAAAGSPASILPVILLLLATAFVTRANSRRICMVAAVGCLLGAGAGLRHVPLESSLLNSKPAGPIIGDIHSDLDVSASGAMTRFNWIDDMGVNRRSWLFLPPAPVIGRGDRIEVSGEIDEARGELVYAQSARVIDKADWIELRRRTVRAYMTDVIHERVPGTPGALTLGLLIGDDSALTPNERDDLRRAGLSHLTAVSGWNVTLVTTTVGLLFLRLGLRGWGWSSLQLVALCGFVWIVGLDPPVTRAAIMAVAGLVAVRLGRPAHSVTVLMLSAALMAAVSPSALTSLSFQLSVVATLGLVLAARLTQDMNGWKAIGLTPPVATATIGIMTAPLLAAEFGTLSLLTVPANILAAPLVPAATIAGVVVIVTSPVAPLAVMAGLGAWLLSALLLWLTRLIASVPYGFHEFAPLSDAVQAGLYAALLLVVTLILPEGRLISHSIVEWVRREPAGAAMSADTACVALLTATLTI
ncbi:MAG: ComEC/Rec2 family competence protein [Chloroflexota bacterium]|nr:ComEC/Rec2 family competence protein [Chloroflexota bacterium]